jgi:hypothetical protein
VSKKILSLLAAAVLTGSLAVAPAATAGPSQGGLASDNVEFITHIPFEVGTATGARVIGNYLYVTSWKSFSIYDVSDPLNPVQESITPFGFAFENEDVATNGEIMIFSEELPVARVHVWNVEDKANPQEIATIPGGEHTMSCILDCKWLYGSDGGIVDLRDPTKPEKMKETWGEGKPAGNAGHDVTEVAPGLVLTSTNPMMFMDARKDPLHPKLLAVSEQMPAFVHSNQWPRNAKDKFALSTGETWTPGTDARCDDNSAGLTSWDTSMWKKTHSFKKIDTIAMKNGTFADGSPAINAPFGCSSHWFQHHPKFKNGGLLAAGFYNHGTRFIDVASNGKLKEVGYFLPHGGGTSGAYWLTDKIVYAVDYQRGVDVLQYNGKL